MLQAFLRDLVGRLCRCTKVDDTMLVEGTDWLYAVGDANGRALLTHQGKYQARAAVPRVAFTDPEVAAFGITEAQAREAGVDVRTVEHDIGQVAGASMHAEGYTGRAKLVIDAERRVVVGATFVGQDVAELLHSATVAIVGEVTLDRLWHAVPSYPTISEVWLRLLETLRSESAERPPGAEPEVAAGPARAVREP